MMKCGQKTLRKYVRRLAVELTERILAAQANLKVIVEFVKDNDILPEKVSKAQGLDSAIKIWAGTQMRYILSGVLSDEEVDVYLDYDFDFGVKPLKWNEWFHMVEDYCKANHTEGIPKGVKTKEGYALDIWFNRQIKNIKKLPPERVEMIRSIKPEKPRKTKNTTTALLMKDYLIEYRGKKYGLCLEFSKETNIPLYIVYDAVKRGISDGEIIVSEYEEKYLKAKEEHPITYEGKTFKNVKEFSDYYSIDANVASVLFDFGDDPKKIVNYCRYVLRGIQGVDNYYETVDASIEYEGQHFDSLKQFSEEYGLNYSKTIYYYNMDYAPDEIIHYCKDEKKEKKSKRAIEYKGRIYETKRQFAEMQGIPYQRLISLLNKGFTAEQIVEFHKGGYTKRPQHGIGIQYDGKGFVSIKAFADYYKLDYQYVSLRYRSGWSCDEIVHPDQYETHKKIMYYKETIPCIEEVEKWEKSTDKKDIYRAARAYYSGVGVEKDLKKAFNLLYQIKDYTQAKLYLAQCYLYGKGTSQDIKQAIILLKEYDKEKHEESSPHFRDKESGVLKRVLPFLLEAYHYDLLLNHDVSSLEQLIYFAVVLNNPVVRLWLYEYYSDTDNIYYDLTEAIKYKE